MALTRTISHEQKLGALIRAEAEAFILARRKKCGGGYEVPSRDTVEKHLSARFNIPQHKVSFYQTYSRSCSHPWSAGACPKCPT
jgi:hypothetical protein